jgi:hypothetical protein
MAIIKSFASYQNLSNFGTFINDQVRTSEYFRITEFNDTFTGGKNGFLIEGSEHLKETTEIKIEILDVTGTPIYYEPGNGIPEYYEGISKIVSVHVYEDTPIGLGKITVLGELKTYIDENGVVRDVPAEWGGVYNVKWERTFNVNKNLANETIVRFYKRPKIVIDEINKPIFNITTPSITQTGLVEGIPQQPVYGTDIRNWTAGTLYKLKIADGTNWTSSVDENVIEIPSLGYSATIKEVLNNKEIFVDVPYLISSSVSNFPATAYTTTFDYVEGQTIINSALTGSFAKIQLSDLKTFVGDVARVKVYRKSRNEIGDYQFIQDTKLESSEILKDITTTANTELSYGQFTESNIKNYWVSGSATHPITINVDKLNASVKVDYTGTNYNNKALFITSQSFSLTEGVEYALAFKTLLSGSVDPTKTLKAYFSGSDYPQQTIVSVTNSAIYTTKQNVTQNVKATKTGDAKLVFEFAGDDWYLANVSLQNAQETSFSPDEFTLIQDIPRKLASETYDFKFEFYDINNNYIPVDVKTSKTFNGGNSFTTTSKMLTFESDRTAFRFSSGSFGNPAFQQIGFKVTKQNLTGSVTYASAAFDSNGNYISSASYHSAGVATGLWPGGFSGSYPGLLTNAGEGGASLTIANFSGSVASVLVGSITYTASCDGLNEFETIYRFEDGDNAPGVFVTANTNQFIYKATDLSLNPSGQIITIEAKRKNLASASTPLEVNIVSSSVLYPAPLLTQVGVANPTNGVDTYIINGTNFDYRIGEAIYSITGSDQFGNKFSDAIKITPIKILDGFSVATSNENTSFSANSVGSIIGGFVASSGSITVKVGNEVISYASPIANNSFSASISSTTGLTPNTFNGTNYSINALSQDSGSLTLLVKYQDGGGTIISSSKEITYSKVKKAAPVLEFVIGNNNQSTDSTSIGTQITAFANSSLSVKEQYNGVTSTLTLANAPTINSSSAFTPITKTTTNLTYPNMVTGTDSVELSITGSVTDSEGVSRNVFGGVSLTKIKKAAPVLAISSTPRNQTVTARSTGFQLDPFVDVSVIVEETYNGSTTNKTLTSLTATCSDISNIATSAASGLVRLVTDPVLGLRTLPNGVDSSLITITAVVTDTEGVSRTLTDTLSLSKVKKAVPNVVISATPQAQSVLANAAGTQTGILSNVTVSALEGTTDRFTSMTATYSGFSTNPNIGGNNNILNTSTAVMNASEASATIVVTHTDSEFTAGLQQTIVVRFTKVVNGSNGTNGTNGDPGANGVTGPGVVHTGVWTSGRTYQFSNGLTDGTGRRDTVLWSTNGNAPYNTYYAATRQHLSATGNVANGAPHQSSQTGWTSLGAQDFFVAAKIGIFEDSFVQKTLNIGTNSNGAMAAANITLAGGSAYPYISIGQSATAGSQGYDVNGIFMGVVNVDNAPVYRLSLKSASNSLKWDGTSLTINGAGTFTGALSGGTISIGSGTSIFKADTTGIWLGNSVFNSAPFSVTAAGVLNAAGATISGTLAASTITGTSINGGSITGGTITGGSITGATITAGAGVIGGWTINQTTLSSNSNSIKLNPSATTPGLEIYDTSNTLRVLVSNQASLTNFGTGDDGITTSGIPHTTTLNDVQTASNASSTYLSVNVLAGGLYSLTSAPAKTITYAGIYNLDIVISQAQLAAVTAYITQAYDPYNPYQYYFGGSASKINFANTQVTAGVSVRQGSSTGTEVANFGTSFGGIDDFEDTTSYSKSIGVYGSDGTGTTRKFTGNFTATASTTYYFVPYISTAFSTVSRDYFGNVSTFSLYVSFNTPRINSITLSKDDNRVELVPGGFQVVASNLRYIKVARTVQDTFVEVGGGITATGNITAFASSDKRLKENIIPIENALDKIEKLDGVEFDWTDEYIQRESNGKGEDNYFFRKHDVGLIAQQVESILPEVVATRDDGYLAIKYEKIVPLLVECIKELKKEINELKENK